MAEISSSVLNEIVRRVTDEVQQEAKAEEAKGFGVADLQARLRDLVETGGGGAERAWKVSGSYDTSDGPKLQSVWRIVIRDEWEVRNLQSGWKVDSGTMYVTSGSPTLSRAWKTDVSYDTSGGPRTEKIEK